MGLEPLSIVRGDEDAAPWLAAGSYIIRAKLCFILPFGIVYFSRISETGCDSIVSHEGADGRAAWT